METARLYNLMNKTRTIGQGYPPIHPNSFITLPASEAARWAKDPWFKIEYTEPPIGDMKPTQTTPVVTNGDPTVRLWNLRNIPRTIGTNYPAIQPNSYIDVPYGEAVRWERDPWFRIDFNGSLPNFPFKENGFVKHMSYHAALQPTEGYGVISYATIFGLTERGINIHMPMPLPKSYEISLRRFAPELVDFHKNARKDWSKWGIVHAIPTEFIHLGSPKRIAHTMFEAVRLPKPWVKSCNKLDYIIVPASGMIDVFQGSGVTTPIEVIPDGIDASKWTYVDRKEKDTFTFISFSRMSDRKCPQEIVRCFQEAFPNEKDVRLIMKTHDKNFGAGTGYLPHYNDERITIIDENWSLDGLIKFVQEADAGVFLSHGEGYFCPPIQSLMTGLPCIVPTHSGCGDWAKEEYCYTVGLDPYRPYIKTTLGARFGDYDDMEWWQMDYEKVTERMREIYENRALAKEKGKLAAKILPLTSSREVMLDKMVDLFNRLD